MKQILLSLLTPIAIGGICLSAFAQIDTSKKINPGNSDKWEIIKGNAKSSTGKLFVTLPKGTEWDMTIYAAGTTKVLSNTSLKTSFTLRPGTYDLEINKIRINGVPVEKGNNTRLKAGVLHMTTTDSWTLYDDPKKIVLINSLSPQERGLPIGKYKISLLGQVQDIEITDEAPDLETPQFLETDKWVITPLLGTEKALLDMNFLCDTTWYMEIIKNGTPIIYLEADNFKSSTKGSSASLFGLDNYVLPPGKYNIKLNGVLLQNVPIMSGYKTRIKVGFLNIKATYIIDDSTMITYLHMADKLPWFLYDKAYDSWSESTPCYMYRKGANCSAVPPGEYGIRIKGAYPVERVIINDRKITQLDVSLGLVSISNVTHINWSVGDDSYKYYYIGKTDKNYTYFELPIGSYTLTYIASAGALQFWSFNLNGFAHLHVPAY